MLAVAASAHALAAILQDEGTLSRGLRTSPLPGMHASVADYWQNNRWCHPLPKEHHSFSDTRVSHPNDPAQMRGRRGALYTEGQKADPGCVLRVRHSRAREEGSDHLYTTEAGCSERDLNEQGSLPYKWLCQESAPGNEPCLPLNLLPLSPRAKALCVGPAPRHRTVLGC